MAPNIVTEVSIPSDETTAVEPKKDYRRPRSIGLFAPILRTKRLLLRFWDRTVDDDALWVLWTFTIPEVEAILGKRNWGGSRESWDAMEEKWHLDPAVNAGQRVLPVYIVDSLETGERIGLASIRQVYKIPDIGYTVLPQHWGKGYATEIADALLRHAREDVGMKTIMAFTVPGHERSWRVLKKIGLEYKGVAWKDGVKPEEGENNVDGAAGTPVFALPGMEVEIWLEDRSKGSNIVNGANLEKD